MQFRDKQNWKTRRTTFCRICNKRLYGTFRRLMESISGPRKERMSGQVNPRPPPYVGGCRSTRQDTRKWARLFSLLDAEKDKIGRARRDRLIQRQSSRAPPSRRPLFS